MVHPQRLVNNIFLMVQAMELLMVIHLYLMTSSSTMHPQRLVNNFFLMVQTMDLLMTTHLYPMTSSTMYSQRLMVQAILEFLMAIECTLSESSLLMAKEMEMEMISMAPHRLLASS